MSVFLENKGDEDIVLDYSVKVTPGRGGFKAQREMVVKKMHQNH